MKLLLVLAIIITSGSGITMANEWVPYNPQPVPVPQPVYQVPVYPVVVVPVMVQYVPVVTYHPIVVEHKQWCLFKRYEIVTIPRITYLPVKY